MQQTVEAVPLLADRYQHATAGIRGKHIPVHVERLGNICESGPQVCQGLIRSAAESGTHERALGVIANEVRGLGNQAVTRGDEERNRGTYPGAIRTGKAEHDVRPERAGRIEVAQGMG